MDMLVYQLIDLVDKFRAARKGTAVATTQPPPAASSASTTTSASSQPKTAATDEETQRQREVIRNSPAVKFLTRTDFFSQVQYSDVSIAKPA